MVNISSPTILQIAELVASLDPANRARFQRIFRVETVTGQLRPPDTMKPWIEQQFGSVDSVMEQRIVKIVNLATLEGALFNELRARRPLWVNHRIDLDEELSRQNHDPLGDPEVTTPEDVFGRVEGRHCVTASNIAKFDGFHGLIVFKERNPLRFDRDMVRDYIETGQRWAERAHAQDPEARYYFFLWNCLWRAGASLLHGHAQVLLSKGMHYPQVEQLRRAAWRYWGQTGYDYFDDLYHAHADIGCAFSVDDVRILAYLTPVKEREVLLVAPAMTDALKDRVYDVLAFYRDQLGVTAFNLVIYQPPLGPAPEHWERFPVIVRLVDRGDPQSRTADIGAMELYASSVVSTDPLQLAAQLREHLIGGS